MQRLFKILLGLVMLGVGGIASLFGFLRLEHEFPVTLPAPTGPFAVGRTTFHWVDNTRIDNLAPVPNQHRELMVWIWYPAAPTASARQAEYLPAPWRAAEAREQGVVMNKFFTSDTARVRTHSQVDADVSPTQSAYPVVMMKSGIGALATDYTVLAEDLASHGYVVVGSDSPYSTFVVVFPDGRVARRTGPGHPAENGLETEQSGPHSRLVKVWAADTSFEVDQLERLNTTSSIGKFRGRLNLQAIGAFGHSFGGAASAQFCHDDRRCKAGMDIDGIPFGSVVQEGLVQPFAFLLSDHASEPDSPQLLAEIAAICGHDPGGCQQLELHGSRHFNFSDQSLLKVRSLMRLAGGLGSIGSRRGLAVTAAYVHTFFDVHLKGAPATMLKDMLAAYPEIRLER